MDILRASPAISQTAQWSALMHGSRTVDDLMSIVQQYVASWRPDELATLPENYQPPQIQSGDDVAFYAFRLVQAQCQGESNHALEQMAAFFSIASQRLSFLMAHAAAFPAEQRALQSSRRRVTS